MKGWQALCWGGRQDSPLVSPQERKRLVGTPPGQHLCLMAFKWNVYLILILALGEAAHLLTPQVWGCILPCCPSGCLCEEMRGYT